MDDLEDFLNGPTPEESPVAEVEAETPEPQPTEESPGPLRDAHGRFAPTGDQPAPAPEPTAAPPAAESQHQIPMAAHAEERRKRQDAEARLAQYEQYIAQLQQQPQPEPFIPSVYEDENGFAHGLTQQAVQLARQQLMPEMQQALGQMKHDMAREFMRQAKPDFDQTEQSFLEMARDNHALIQEANRQANPVAWAYDYAKKAQEVRQLGSMDLAAIKQAAVQEYLAQQTPAPAPQTIPSTLADSQSARGSHAAPLGGPPSLNDILGRR